MPARDGLSVGGRGCFVGRAARSGASAAASAATMRTYAFARLRDRLRERLVLSRRFRGDFVQEGGPTERLRGVREVAPLVEAALGSKPVPVDTRTLTFADFYRATFTEMTRLAFLLTGSPETARDLVQDSFVRLHGKWDGVAEPHAYLRRTVVNACHSHHRRLRRQRQRRHAWPSQVDVADLGADEMTDAIGALPYRQRAAIVLRFWHDSSEAEIAAALGCRPGTIGSLIHRALAELRKVMP